MAAIGVALIGQQVGGWPCCLVQRGGRQLLVVPVRHVGLAHQEFTPSDRDDAGGVLGPGAGCVELRLAERSR